MKNIINYILKGLFIGFGFGIAVISSIYIYDHYPSKPLDDFEAVSEEKRTEYLKEMIAAIDRKGPDLCKEIEGTWVGSIEEDNGSIIRSFESHYKANGEFESTHTNKSIANEVINTQTGTWECKNSVLFNRVNNDGRLNYYNYLIFHNENGERIYARIGNYALKGVYKVVRRD